MCVSLSYFFSFCSKRSCDVSFAGEHVEQQVSLSRLESPATHALAAVMAKAQRSDQRDAATHSASANGNRSPMKSPLKKQAGESVQDDSLRIVCLSFNLKGQPFADHNAAADAAAPGASAENAADGDAYSAVR